MVMNALFNRFVKLENSGMLKSLTLNVEEILTNNIVKFVMESELLLANHNLIILENSSFQSNLAKLNMS
jgi:hypothetical protein